MMRASREFSGGHTLTAIHGRATQVVRGCAAGPEATVHHVNGLGSNEFSIYVDVRE